MTETTADILTGILARRGALTPSVVVDEARNPESPLHHRFVWDDSEAAEAYRRVQAAHLIRSVHITLVAEPDKPAQRVRKFLPVSPTDGDDDGALSSYLPVEEIALDPRKRAIVEAQMEREWRQMRRRWSTHRAFWQMVQADLDDGAAGQVAS